MQCTPDLGNHSVFFKQTLKIGSWFSSLAVDETSAKFTLTKIKHLNIKNCTCFETQLDKKILMNRKSSWSRRANSPQRFCMGRS